MFLSFDFVSKMNIAASGPLTRDKCEHQQPPLLRSRKGSVAPKNNMKCCAVGITLQE